MQLRILAVRQFLVLGCSGKEVRVLACKDFMFDGNMKEQAHLSSLQMMIYLYLLSVEGRSNWLHTGLALDDELIVL